MAILNDLSNHVDWIRDGLTTLTLDIPDVLQQVIDTRARYKTGVQGSGFSFTHLRNSPDVTYYTGADRDQSSENDPETIQIIIDWTDMMVPVQFLGTDLQKTVGIQANDLLRADSSLSGMADDDRLMFLDFIESQLEVTAYAIQQARVNVLWGRTIGVQMANVDRLPMSVPDLFNQETGLYRQPREILGGYERQHVWGGGHYRWGASLNFLMVPRVFDFAYTDGGKAAYTANNSGEPVAAGTTETLAKNTPNRAHTGSGSSRDALNAGQARGILNPDGTLDEDAFQVLQSAISSFSQVVPGRKLAICNDETFSALAIGFRGDQYPQIQLDRWEYTIDSIRIGSVTFVSDPNKTPDSTTIEIFHIGDNEGNRGSFFPFYWDPGASLRARMRAKIDNKIRNVSGAPTFGTRRKIPVRMDDFGRFEGWADAVGTRLRLSSMNVCTNPERQCQFINIAARTRTANNVP